MAMLDALSTRSIPWATSALLLVVGLAIGTGAVLAVEEPGLAALWAGPPPIPEAECDDEPSLRARLDEALEAAKAAGKGAQADALHTRQTQGESQPWPSNPAAALTREVASVAVKKAVSGRPVTLYRTSCREFPCLFTLLGPGDPHDQAWRIRVERRLAKAGYDLSPPGRVVFFKDPAEALYVLPLWVGDAPSPELKLRVKHRISVELAEAYGQLHPPEEG